MQLLGILAAIVILIFTFTGFFGNSWNSLVNSHYIIPSESSVFEFKPLQMSGGSEPTWVFAEDGDNYYYNDVRSKSYKLIPKDKTENCEGFMLSNVTTWCKKEDDYKKAVPKKTQEEVNQELDDEYADPWK